MGGMTPEEWREDQIQRGLTALESIAASLEKIANPPVRVPSDSLEAFVPMMDKHVTSTEPGECRVDIGDQWVVVKCRKHIHLPPHTEGH